MRLRSRLAVRAGCAAFAAAAVIVPAVPGSWASPSAGPPAVTAAAPRASSSDSLQRVRLLGEDVIPQGLTMDGAGVGELSGLDYDRHTGTWYFLSDDSEEGPARFYTADIAVDAHGLGKVRLTGAADIRRTDGSVFPPLASNDPEVADPESIRVDPRSGALWWSSEGKREVPADGSAPALVDPWVRQMTTHGQFLRQVHQPRLFQMSADERGPRRNA
ncbi:MAG TPA: esterase-like activity of phytase family protein, partial [Actinopolymorphaceae bacterium]|nr:esterase-like activity of phytase family protein [Actinopolymorphaceae bacterium]